MSGSITLTPTGRDPMARAGKKPTEKPAEERQINIRCGPRLYARLADVADALGLDVAPLVRMVLTEQLAIYERRAEKTKKGESPTD